ncbi:MAG TPA: DUF4446 family protein [Actinomycetota bacterium]|nr:DUF4446 family protein [Actinomycetota bacterium]
MDQQTLIAVVAGAVALLALGVAAVANNRLTHLRRSMAILQGKNDAKTLLEVISDNVQRVEGFEKVLRSQAKRQEELFALLGRSARNLGVVRYDAFDDMGGKMSFSAALLDDHGNGLVITSINARAESRAYAKPIKGGSSEHNLSAEEQRAIANALGAQQKVKR